MSKEIKTTAPEKGTRRKLPKARTPEARENQLINLAMNLVEKQLMEGTATSQVITHFLKLATVKEELENEKLKADLRLAEAKIDSIHSQSEIKELYVKAMDAMKRYAGYNDPEGEPDEC